MKRCPQCNSAFEDLYRYCDLDGTPLIDDEMPDPNENPKPAENWKILAIGAIAGLSIGVVLFVIYHGLTRRWQPNDSQATANAGVGTQLPSVSLQAEPTSIAVPSPEPSPSPSPSPSSSPSPSPTPAPIVKLSSSPISTGATAETRVTIRLMNGATIEADEAWKGPEGIWYRYRGVVALLDPAQVKSIERPPPSPSSSPTVQPSRPK
jgi:hypothetical protein